MKEFELIDTFFMAKFASLSSATGSIVMGIGDDCAVLAPGSLEMVVSTDTMVAGRHFPEDCSAQVVAARSLAAAASDLAAMGADPLGYTLAIAIPGFDGGWLMQFSDTLLRCSEKWQLPLVGGDTVRGPLVVSITVFGCVGKGQSLLRAGAREGDDIWVSGFLGNAAGGLNLVSGRAQSDLTEKDSEYLRRSYEAPEPRLRLGKSLSGIATSAIDISDGLLADLGHILNAAEKGAIVHVENMPVSGELIQLLGKDKAITAALTGGDDYELCFTAAPADQENILACATKECLGLSRIGSITAERGLKVLKSGRQQEIVRDGFDHFSN